MELRRLKQELSGEIVFPMVTDRHGQTKTQTGKIISNIFERLEAIFGKQMQASGRPQKPMLLLAEASTVSRLPK